MKSKMLITMPLIKIEIMNVNANVGKNFIKTVQMKIQSIIWMIPRKFWNIMIKVALKVKKSLAAVEKIHFCTYVNWNRVTRVLTMRMKHHIWEKMARTSTIKHHGALKHPHSSMKGSLHNIIDQIILMALRKTLTARNIQQ